MTLAYDLGTKMIGWGSAMAVCAVLGTIFLVRAVKARKSDVISVKWINIGYTLFFYFYILTRLFFLFSDFERINTPEGSPDTLMYTRYVLFAYLWSLTAIVFIIFTIERWMLAREKKTLTWLSVGFTLICAAFAVMTFFIDNSNLINIARATEYAGAGLFFVILLYLMYKLAKDSSGIIKRNAIISLVGVVLIVTGILMDSEFLVRLLGPELIWLPGIMASVGLVIFGFGQRRA